MKPILTAVLAVLVLATPVASQPPPVVATAHRSTVYLATDMGEGSQYCTGVAIGILNVLTAEHCLSESGDGTTVNGQIARVVKRGEWLALLQLNEPLNLPLMPIADRNAPVGGDATAIGYVDMAGTLLTLKRAVAGYSVGGLNKMFVDGPLIQGMSGGPVINEKGQLIGINQATNQFTGLISHVKEIRDFLK